MLNPDDLISAWVTKLSSIAALVSALGGEKAVIEGYFDSAVQDDPNLRAAILQRPPGSILVVYMGTDRTRVQGALAWRHNFQFVVQASPFSQDGQPPASYGKLWSLFVGGVPAGTLFSLLRTSIHSGCYPMDLELPTSSRQSILVTLEGATFEYFQFNASLVEIGDN